MAESRLLRKEIPLTGKLVTSVDPATIGPNFQTLTNLRYTDTGIRSISGMSVINSTETSTTYKFIRNLFQFIKGNGEEYIFAQAWDTATVDSPAVSNLYYNSTAVPNTGNFTGVILNETGSTVNIGRFSYAPDDTMVYCNGNGVYIYGGTESRCAGFINHDDGDGDTFVYDYEDVITNSLTDSVNVATIKQGTAFTQIYIGSTRPLKGVKFYVGTANTTVATTSLWYWGDSGGGLGWLAVTGLSDGTASGGVPFAQTGTMSFTSTLYTPEPREYQGIALYWYRVMTTAGIDNTTTVTQCTLDTDFQALKDIPSGETVDLTSMIYHRGSSYEEYATAIFATDYVSGSAITYMDMSSLATTDSIRPGSPVQLSGLDITFGDNNVNTLSTIVTVEYWTGSGWTAVDNLVDNTQNNPGNTSFNTSGTITWNPPSSELEFKRNLTGIPHYYYRIKPLSNMSATIYVDSIKGIPAPTNIGLYRFSVFAMNRLFLCDNISGKQNTTLVSAEHTNSVFNGSDSATLFFGDDKPLIAGIGLYRQFGSSLYNILVMCKATETWLLIGNHPDDWIQYRASDVIGCVAPLTMRVSHISPEELSSISRSSVIWQSGHGIHLFDGSVIQDIHGDIDDIFDQNNSYAIDTDYIDKSVGDYDFINGEYHWMYSSKDASPAGSLDKEWVYDVRRKRWYEIDRGTGEYLQCSIPVVDSIGNHYNYGAENDGKVYRLENGNDMDGNDITYTFRLGDQPLHEDSIMTETQLRYVKLVTKALSTSTNNISVTYYADGVTTGTSLTSFSSQKSGYRILESVQSTGGRGTFHSTEFSITTNNEPVGFEPLFVGYNYKVLRQDTN